MSRPSRRWRPLVATALCLSLAVACDDTPVQKADPKPASAKSDEKSKRGATRGGEAAPVDTSAPPPKMEFHDSDFAETETSRDPFRSFADIFGGKVGGAVQVKRKVILEDFSVEELRLIGIVTRINPAKAMLVDPRGQGHVVHRGDFIGKPERVQGSSLDQEFELHWRIDRIRDADLVLVREDPTNPDVPSATRVIALRPEEAALD